MIEHIDNHIKTSPVVENKQGTNLNKTQIVSIYMLLILAEKNTLDGNENRQKMTEEKQKAAAALQALNNYESDWEQHGYNTDRMKKVLAQFEKAGLIDDHSIWGKQLKEEILGNIAQIEKMQKTEKDFEKIANQYNKDKKKLEKYAKAKDKDSNHTSVIKWLVNGWKEWTNAKYRHECDLVDQQTSVLEKDAQKLTAVAKGFAKKYDMPASSANKIMTQYIPEQENIAAGKMSGYLNNTYNQLNTVVSKDAKAENTLLQEIMGQNLI